MSISDIQNKYLRRSVILIAIMPLSLLAFVLAMGGVLVSVVKEIPEAFVDAWKGTDNAV